jgi:hypothetical protein
MMLPTTSAHFWYFASGEPEVAVHPVEDAALHRLQTVAHVRERAAR